MEEEILGLLQEIEDDIEASKRELERALRGPEREYFSGWLNAAKHYRDAIRQLLDEVQ